VELAVAAAEAGIPVAGLDEPTRTAVGKAVRAALSPYTAMAGFANVVFLTCHKV